MSKIPRLEVKVEVRTIVREYSTSRLLVDLTTTGVNDTPLTDVIATATAPALADALADHASMIEAYQTMTAESYVEHADV